MIRPAVDWSKCVNEVLFPMAKNSSVPSLDILNLSATVMVEVLPPTSFILPSPRLIETFADDISRLPASNSKLTDLIFMLPPLPLM